ncbi:MAG TPA: preprotein translocase subunit SecG [Gemmatimonadaceae bacterium]|jgi:preprotein translocase subunit SecG|nr:preprotein translocase subunit SecG [Gemmatimonadaceae bacterium]
MYTLLIVLLVLASIFLILVILMQSGKGGGLAATFGGVGTSPDSFFGTRQMGNVLTKASWYLGGAFLVLGFVLSLMSSRAVTSRSILDQPAGSQTAAPAAPAPGASDAPIPLENAPATQPEPGATPSTPRP